MFRSAWIRKEPVSRQDRGKRRFRGFDGKEEAFLSSKGGGGDRRTETRRKGRNATVQENERGE